MSKVIWLQDDNNLGLILEKTREKMSRSLCHKNHTYITFLWLWCSLVRIGEMDLLEYGMRACFLFMFLHVLTSTSNS